MASGALTADRRYIMPLACTACVLSREGGKQFLPCFALSYCARCSSRKKCHWPPIGVHILPMAFTAGSSGRFQVSCSSASASGSSPSRIASIACVTAIVWYPPPRLDVWKGGLRVAGKCRARHNLADSDAVVDAPLHGRKLVLLQDILLVTERKVSRISSACEG
jgi:hypothetical protein